ncbi:uncharacterized protein EV420DRAFT_1505223 [Desarmillaria tabescens]|uniref:Prolyl 4-hydroxylase alpha subunit Fe(2+) 2OG dioxygenase domain-containing protein n=1 Tax=Armillaria tabescens TaxID=1929756 RepID=A0AA39NJH0_ARMTA|nr:uncharacterized protein EV420DRAFT_1505223 [Desarmillaria tabescens]KAK0466765.1 hypothetical protein EV420DRAFT_1505223 [Desarmillaria tabescens]
MTKILDQIRVDLMEGHLSTEKRIRPELYKLNIYGEGSFFKSHKDTPSHQGGGLALRSHGKEWVFDASSLLANSTTENPEIAYVAFYSDVEHEVFPVTSGSRVTLTYNLYQEQDTHTEMTFKDTRTYDITSDIKESISRLIDDPEFLPRGGKLGFGLRHQYPLSTNRGPFEVEDVVDLLKGSDAAIYRACQSLSLSVNVRISYMPRGDGKRSYLTDSEFGNFQLWEESLRSWMVQDGVESVKEQEDWQDSRVYNSTRIFWVTPRTELSRVTTTFAYYGNEPDIGYLYGDICLVVDLAPAGGSGEESGSEGEEVGSSSESDGFY